MTLDNAESHINVSSFSINIKAILLYKMLNTRPLVCFSTSYRVFSLSVALCRSEAYSEYRARRFFSPCLSAPKGSSHQLHSAEAEHQPNEHCCSLLQFNSCPGCLNPISGMNTPHNDSTPLAKSSNKRHKMKSSRWQAGAKKELQQKPVP